jgi:ferrochelatase
MWSIEFFLDFFLAKVSETHDFLKNLFSDHDLIPLPFQRASPPLLHDGEPHVLRSSTRTLAEARQYFVYTQLQGEGMTRLLDELHPETAPHKAYIAFRYAHPLTLETARQMKADGVTRAVAFTQYPQYSCSTTGSSLNELYRRGRAGDINDVEWSVIDRWGIHPGFIEVRLLNILAATEFKSKFLPYFA